MRGENDYAGSNRLSSLLIDDVQSNDELFFHRDPTLVALVALRI